MDNNKTISRFVFTALAALATYSTQAAVGSDLKVIQEAAQTGMWTVVSTGSVGGLILPNINETACLTKAEILQNFNHALWVSDGAESKDCPTKLTINTVFRGVATATCQASKLVVNGTTTNLPKKTINIEFEKIESNQWTSKMDNRLTRYTFHGSTTADCINNR